jgi:hypothetical protein
MESLDVKLSCYTHLDAIQAAERVAIGCYIQRNKVAPDSHYICRAYALQPVVSEIQLPGNGSILWKA